MARDVRQMSPEARMQHLLDVGDNRCAWCGYDLTRSNARPTRDHVVPKIKGGPTRLENEVAACGACNSRRGHASPSQFIEESRRDRGLDPNARLVAEQLAALDAAIHREGGMRKIRDYVARELKRVTALAGD